jgi:hypothetical protein
MPFILGSGPGISMTDECPKGSAVRYTEGLEAAGNK